MCLQLCTQRKILVLGLHGDELPISNATLATRVLESLHISTDLMSCHSYHYNISAATTAPSSETTTATTASSSYHHHHDHGKWIAVESMALSVEFSITPSLFPVLISALRDSLPSLPLRMAAQSTMPSGVLRRSTSCTRGLEGRSYQFLTLAIACSRMSWSRAL